MLQETARARILKAGGAPWRGPRIQLSPSMRLPTRQRRHATQHACLHVTRHNLESSSAHTLFSESMHVRVARRAPHTCTHRHPRLLAAPACKAGRRAPRAPSRAQGRPPAYMRSNLPIEYLHEHAHTSTRGQLITTSQAGWTALSRMNPKTRFPLKECLTFDTLAMRSPLG